MPFGPDIWISDGGIVDVAGFRYPTRMAVMKLPGGGLFVWSPTALSEDLKHEVDALGPVGCIIAPNSLHHLSIPAWKAAYPSAKLFAAPGLRKRRADIAFNGDLGDAPAPEWAGCIDQVTVRGNAITTEVVFFHRPSNTVLFTDLLQHFPKGWFRGWRGLIAKLDRMTASEPEVLQKFRVAFTDRKAAHAALVRILAWPSEKVLMAHGAPVTTDGAAFLRRAFRWLIR
jgi:hypothetical protein